MDGDGLAYFVELMRAEEVWSGLGWSRLWFMVLSEST